MATAKDLFADLVAGTAAWQAITGTNNAGAAKAFIYKWGTDSGTPVPAMFVRAEVYRRERISTDGFQASGRLRVGVDFARPSGQASRRAEEDLIEDVVEGLIDAVVERSVATGVFSVRAMEMVRAPVLDLEGTADECWSVELVVDWPDARG